MAAKKQKKEKTPGKGSWISDLGQGRTISMDFFKANAWLLVLFLVMIIALIGLRYKT